MLPMIRICLAPFEQLLQELLQMLLDAARWLAILTHTLKFDSRHWKRRTRIFS